MGRVRDGWFVATFPARGGPEPGQPRSRSPGAPPPAAASLHFTTQPDALRVVVSLSEIVPTDARAQSRPSTLPRADLPRPQQPVLATSLINCRINIAEVLPRGPCAPRPEPLYRQQIGDIPCDHLTVDTRSWPN